MALKRTITIRGKYAPGTPSAKRFKSTRQLSFKRKPTFIPWRFGQAPMSGGVPPLMRTQLIYSSGIGYFNKTIAANTNATFLFHGNGLYDPDAQAGGQQPMGFDQWTFLYKHYRVIGSKCEVTLGQSALTQVALNSGPSGFVSQVFDAQNSSALPNSKISMGHTSGGVMAGQIVLRDYQRSDRITGFQKDEENLSAQYNANPATPWYWAITVCNGDAVNAQNYSFNVRITYYVEFFHPQVLNMS